VANIRINTFLGIFFSVIHLYSSLWVPLIVIFIWLCIVMLFVLMLLLLSVVFMIVGIFNIFFYLVDAFNVTMNGFDISMTSLSNNDASNSMVELVKRGGIMSMTEIIVTIFCGYAFAGIVEASGSLKVILSTISSKISKDSHLIFVTIAGSLILVFAA